MLIVKNLENLVFFSPSLSLSLSLSEINKKNPNVCYQSFVLIPFVFFSLCVCSGEIAMKSLMEGFGWAVNPMLPRIPYLDQSIAMSFIYGEHTWNTPSPGVTLRRHLGSKRVTVDIVPNATHHVFAEEGVFNSLVNYYCRIVDRAQQESEASRNLSPSYITLSRQTSL